jgi:hypothetical protein
MRTSWPRTGTACTRWIFGGKVAATPADGRALNTGTLGQTGTVGMSRVTP